MTIKQYTIPIFVPHLGCPFDCVFCNQERITGKSTNVDGDGVREIIEEYLGYFDRKDRRLEVGFFGGSFTGISAEHQEELLKVAHDYKKEGKIDAIRLSTRPDFINEKILNRLNKYSVDTIELGVQSLSEEVLEKSGRGHDREIVYRSAEMIKKAGFNLGLQMMLGLPGDSYERSLETVKEFIGMEAECVRIYPTLVIKDTELERAYKRGDYLPLSLEDAVDFSSQYLMRFQLKDINVIRLGLQATKNIQDGRDVVAGPFHPAFGQLVESNIYKILLDRYFSELDFDLRDRDLLIYANKRNISSVVGQKSSNKTFLMEKYKFKSLRFMPENINFRDLIIEVDGRKQGLNYYEAIESYINLKEQ